MTPRLSSRALAALAARGGKPGAAVALRLDLLRSGVLSPDSGDEIPGRHDLYRELWATTGATIHDLGDGFLVLSRGGRQVVVCDNQVPLDDPVTLRLAAHKPLAGGLLGAAGLPVPRSVAFSVDDLAPAQRLLADAGTCVVKPASGTGAGLGVTCGVRTDDDLARAAARAARWGQALVAEQQATGDEYRVLVLDGRVLATLRRRPPRVVGDGVATVAALVARENEHRVAARARAGLWPLALDLDAVLALERQGLSPRRVPHLGRVVEIGTTANENGPADNDTVDAPDALRRAACDAAAALGLRLASVEVVTPDAAVPLAEAGGSIVEVNGTPGLHYHAQVADPSTAVDVFTPILETLLREPSP